MDFKKTIQTEYQDEIICPFCGHEYEDSWDLELDEDDYTEDIECGNCEKKFWATINKSITFSTKKPDKK